MESGAIHLRWYVSGNAYGNTHLKPFPRVAPGKAVVRTTAMMQITLTARLRSDLFNPAFRDWQADCLERQGVLPACRRVKTDSDGLPGQFYGTPRHTLRSSTYTGDETRGSAIGNLGGRHSFNSSTV